MGRKRNFKLIKETRERTAKGQSRKATETALKAKYGATRKEANNAIRDSK